MPCPYATILGIRGQGFHSSRIFGLSLYDILGTIGLAILTAYIFNLSFFSSFIGWFLLGELLHILFGADTAFLEMVGITPRC